MSGAEVPRFHLCKWCDKAVELTVGGFLRAHADRLLLPCRGSRSRLMCGPEVDEQAPGPPEGEPVTYTCGCGTQAEGRTWLQPRGWGWGESGKPTCEPCRAPLPRIGCPPGCMCSTCVRRRRKDHGARREVGACSDVFPALATG